MKGKRRSPEQAVRKLREASRLLAEGADIDGVCRHFEVSVQTYQRWRSHFKRSVRRSKSLVVQDRIVACHLSWASIPSMS